LEKKHTNGLNFRKSSTKKIFDIDKSEDKQLGDFFEKADNKNIISRDVFLNKILFYLWNDVCKDGEGEIFKIKKDNKDEDIRFSNFFEDSSETNGKLQGMMEFLKKTRNTKQPGKRKINNKKNDSLYRRIFIRFGQRSPRKESS
jgi:hypothetical protein